VAVRTNQLEDEKNMVTATVVALIALAIAATQAVRFLRNLLTARPAVPSTEIQ
jgi:hypothetical protein